MRAREMLFERDPYEGLDVSNYQADLQGWGGHPAFCDQVVAQVVHRLRTAVEVGTWKGRSAMFWGHTMGGYRYTKGYEPELVCVDTWTGAAEFWGNHEDPKRYQSLKIEHGMPTVYFQFLANMVHEKLEKTVTPFPVPSLVAAQVFKARGVRFQLVYVDASHEYQDVKADLHAWYDLLSDPEGDVICGDDYCPHWSGVMRAVNEFAAEKGLYLETRRYPNKGQAPSDYWVLTKRGGVLK